jgi:hypothetical protein
MKSIAKKTVKLQKFVNRAKITTFVLNDFNCSASLSMFHHAPSLYIIEADAKKFCYLLYDLKPYELQGRSISTRKLGTFEQITINSYTESIC